MIKKGRGVKIYSKAPLPFQGQKRFFRKELEAVLKEFDDNSIFLDLFGGSGLISRIIKDNKPNARVVYNDFDNYCERIKNIPITNEITTHLRQIVGDRYKINEKVSQDDKEKILSFISEKEKQGVFIDYLTIGSFLLFGGQYAHNFGEFAKLGFYKDTFPVYNADNYLDGLEIRRSCWSEILKEFKGVENVVLVMDPPYLQTDKSGYKMANTWSLGSFLKLFNAIDRPFIFFSSTRSEFGEFLEFCKESGAANVYLKNAKKLQKKASINHVSTYIDELYWCGNAKSKPLEKNEKKEPKQLYFDF